MNNNEKKRTKSLYELYGVAKFGINPKKFKEIDGGIDDQIKGSMDLIFFNKLVPQNYGYFIISFTIIGIFFVIFSRQFVLNFFEVAKNDWENYKCDPRIMAYSGYIKKNEGSTEFLSTGDNFNECIEPISRYIAEKNFNPFNSVVNVDLTNLMNTMNDSFSSLQGSLNSLKDQINNIFSMISLEENKKNEESVKVSQTNLSTMLNVNALFQSIADLVTGVNISIQSVLTYVYGFFEGALVLVASILVLYLILAGSLIYLGYGLSITGGGLFAGLFTAPAAPAVFGFSATTFAIGAVYFSIALAFLLIFLSIVIVMLMYSEFLKTVFNIDVQSRKTKTPSV